MITPKEQPITCKHCGSKAKYNNELQTWFCNGCTFAYPVFEKKNVSYSHEE